MGSFEHINRVDLQEVGSVEDFEHVRWSVACKSECVECDCLGFAVGKGNRVVHKLNSN